MKIQFLPEVFDHAGQLFIGAVEEGRKQPPHRAFSQEGGHQKIPPVLWRSRKGFQIMQRLGLAPEFQLVFGQFEPILQQAKNGSGVAQTVLPHARKGSAIGQAPAVEHYLDIPVPKHPIGVGDTQQLLH